MSPQPSHACFNCGGKFPEEAYGLTECPSCKTLVLIDFEGNVQKPSDPLDEPEDLNADKSQAENQQETHHQESSPASDVFEESSSAHEVAPDMPPDIAEDVPLDTASDVVSEQEALDQNPITENSGEDDPSIAQQQADSHQKEFDLTPDEALSSSDGQQGPPTSDDLQDVIDYVHSSNANTGGLHYNVTILGIDSQKIREAVLDVLEDSRLGWQPEDIAKCIKDGVLDLQNINATKMYVLVSSLKFLPVKVHWDQIS